MHAFTTCCLLVYFPRPVSLIACFFLYLKYPLSFVLIICFNGVFFIACVYINYNFPLL